MTIANLEQVSGGIVKQTKYLKKNPLRRYFIQQYLSGVLSLTQRVPTQHVLDVGCGEGFVIQHLRQHLSHIHLTGIDIEPAVLKVAAYQNPTSTLSIALAHQLPLPSQSYDLVLCNEVLEHLASPQTALQELKRVGRSHFILSVPREPHYRLANMAAGANWPRWGDDIDHCQRWTRAQFLHMLSQQFNIVHVLTPFPWTMVLCQHP